MLLKYKAFLLSTKEMINIKGFTSFHEGNITLFYVDKEGSTTVMANDAKILPYTGVKDINKKESYLGDILKEPVHQYSSKKDIEKKENSFGIVKKYKNSNNLYLEWNFRRKYEGEYYWDSNELPITHIDRYEIVGNIYTDPDMIKKEP